MFLLGTYAKHFPGLPPQGPCIAPPPTSLKPSIAQRPSPQSLPLVFLSQRLSSSAPLRYRLLRERQDFGPASTSVLYACALRFGVIQGISVLAAPVKGSHFKSTCRWHLWRGPLVIFNIPRKPGAAEQKYCLQS